ncbi:class I SAM-dependent methyltransferase [Mycolicibacterium sp. CBM1]
MAVGAMPRGGPDASWWDQLFETEALEYIDRSDAPDRLKQRVIAGLAAVGERFGTHRRCARLALDVVSDIPNPRILEIGSGHGKVSQEILNLHPTATITASDLDPTSVANMSGGVLGSHPRASAHVIDATAIDSADDAYDLAVFVLGFHRLQPEQAYRAISEATRVAHRFLVIDLERSSPLAMLRRMAMVPMSLALMPISSIIPTMHDGVISSLRAYSRSAFVALGKAVDPNMEVELLTKTRVGADPPALTVLFSRPATGSKWL